MSGGTKYLLAAASAGGGEFYIFSSDSGGAFYDCSQFAIASDFSAVYVPGSLSNDYPRISKYDLNTPAADWRSTVDASGGLSILAFGYSTTLDEANSYVYCLGFIRPTGVGYDGDGFIAQMDTSTGVVNWQRYFGVGTTSVSTDNFASAQVDGSGNVYAVGDLWLNRTGTLEKQVGIAKYSTAGTFVTGIGLGDPTEDTGDSPGANVGSAFDGTNIIASSKTFVSARSRSEIQVAWVNTTLTSIVTNYSYGSASATIPNVSGVHCASSGNIYVVGSDRSVSPRAGLVLKLDSSGNVVWARTVQLVAGDAWIRDASEDASGNVYVTFNSLGSPSSAVLKFDSSGTLLWANSLDYGRFHSLKADTDGGVYVTGSSVNARLPADGSGTGTYGSYTYASFSPTVSSVTFTRNTGVWSLYTPPSYNQGSLSATYTYDTPAFTNLERF